VSDEGMVMFDRRRRCRLGQERTFARIQGWNHTVAAGFAEDEDVDQLLLLYGVAVFHVPPFAKG
jgi:hypothetical protein